MNSHLKEWLETGKYSKIIDQSHQIRGTDKKYLLAALSFSGEIDQAQVLYQKTKWEKGDQVEVDFYWLLSSIRTQEYLTISEAFLDLYHHYESEKNQKNKYYLYQGLALTRFYQGFFLSSCHFANLAYKIAIELQNDYFCMISTDLAGHSFSKRGAYARGEHYLNLSLNFANMLEKNLHSQVIHLALLNYRVEAGVNLSEQNKSLDNWKKNILPEDFYSYANALLLKVQILIFKGDLKRAKTELQTASTYVFKFGHRRQLFEYNLKLVQIHKIQGEIDIALNIAHMTLKLCEKDNDEFYQYLFSKLLVEIEDSQLGVESRRLKKLERKIGIVTGEGRITFWKSRIDKEGVTSEILIQLDNEDLLGILFLNKIYSSKNWINFSFGREQTLISLGGEIKIIKKLSPNQLALLRLLSTQRLWSKKTLYESFWGGEYDSFIHDNKIYVTLKRLKNKLSFSTPLFHLRQGQIEVEEFDRSENEISFQERPFVEAYPNPEHLNIRQAQLLAQINSSTIIKPSDYAKRFQISRNTASRDLSELVSMKKLIRHGNKRGTYYSGVSVS